MVEEGSSRFIYSSLFTFLFNNILYDFFFIHKIPCKNTLLSSITIHQIQFIWFYMPSLHVFFSFKLLCTIFWYDCFFFIHKLLTKMPSILQFIFLKCIWFLIDSTCHTFTSCSLDFLFTFLIVYSHSQIPCKNTLLSSITIHQIYFSYFSSWEGHYRNFRNHVR